MESPTVDEYIYSEKNNTEKITKAKRKKMRMAATMIRQLVQFLPALRGWLPLPTSWALYWALYLECTVASSSQLGRALCTVPAGQGDHCAVQAQCSRALELSKLHSALQVHKSSPNCTVHTMYNVQVAAGKVQFTAKKGCFSGDGCAVWGVRLQAAVHVRQQRQQCHTP